MHTILSITYGSKLNNVLQTIQELMCKNVSGIQRFIETNIIDAGVPTIKQKGPVTISQMYEIELIRTIV